MSADLSTIAEVVPAGGGARVAAPRPERERLLREREEARARARTLAEVNRQMVDFLEIAAHELRTPATSGSLAVALVGRRLDALLANVCACDAELADQVEPIRELLGHARGSMERLSWLVVDLLDVSRIQASTLDLHLARCDLAAVVRQVVEEQRRIAPDRDIRLRLPGRPVAPVLADADRIGQVATNYLTNALRYAPQDRPVELCVRVGRHWARVAVRDAGPGLPPVELRHVWGRFHRAAGIQPVSGAAAGLGLGLHICKTIVEQHRGRVGLRSAPGRGSTFWFALAVAGVDRPCGRRGGDP